MSTLVREDLFAGFLANDMAAFERGEQTLARLEKEHPDKAGVTAWQGSALIYRAVLAHEAKQPEKFRDLYDKGIAACESAGFQSTKHIGVLIVCGASHLIFADRLPVSERTQSNKIAYQGYRRAMEVQAAQYKQFPLHFKGELLAGLAQSGATHRRFGGRSKVSR